MKKSIKLSLLTAVCSLVSVAHADLAWLSGYVEEYNNTASASDYTAYIINADLINAANPNTINSASDLLTWIQDYNETSIYDVTIPDAYVAQTFNSAKEITGTTVSFEKFLSYTLGEGNYYMLALCEVGGITYGNVIDNTYAFEGNLQFDGTSSATAATGWEMVPEPTSGMLMLVGFGLMALKRKRA